MQRTVQGDLTCRRCSYNLRGLKSPGVCPECGTAFHLGRRYASNFTDVPLASLAIQAKWLLALVVSGLAMWVAVLAAMFLYAWEVDLQVVSMVLVPLAAAWAGAVTMVTWPWAAHDDLLRPEPQRRAKPLRAVVWVTGLCALAGALSLVFATSALEVLKGRGTAPVGTISLEYSGAFQFACACGVLAYVGLVVLGFYLAGLADWYEDTDLCERMKSSVLLVVVVPLPLIWALCVPPRGLLTLPAFGVACIALLVLIFFLSRPFVQLAMLSRSAVSSAALSHDHEARAARKVIQRIEQGKAKAEAPRPDEPSIPLAAPEPVRPVAAPKPRTSAATSERHPAQRRKP
jgi:hypothetical protein